MGTPYFRFRQFTVWHDRCAMKVGTDGVLLGAWADVAGAQEILDAGCGTGLIALMAAQRADTAHVTAIDIDAEAVNQARDNVSRSPFAFRINVRQCDMREMEGQFDSILCNPPFFTEDTLPPDSSRATARNAAALSAAQLVAASAQLLCYGGSLHVILPYEQRNVFISGALSHSLHLCRECAVHTTARKQPKRILLSFRHAKSAVSCPSASAETLVLQQSDGTRSEAYRALTKDFYLS